MSNDAINWNPGAPRRWTIHGRFINCATKVGVRCSGFLAIQPNLKHPVLVFDADKEGQVEITSNHNMFNPSDDDNYFIRAAIPWITLPNSADAVDFATVRFRNSCMSVNGDRSLHLGNISVIAENAISEMAITRERCEELIKINASDPEKQVLILRKRKDASIRTCKDPRILDQIKQLSQNNGAELICESSAYAPEFFICIPAVALRGVLKYCGT